MRILKPFFVVLAAIALVAFACFFWFVLLCIIGGFLLLMIIAWVAGVSFHITENGKTVAIYRWFTRIK